MGDKELAAEIRRVVGSADITDEALASAIRILVAEERGQKRYSLAHELRVVRPTGQAHAELWVDGEPFPWYTQDGFHIDLNRSEIPNVTLTLRGETLVVEDDMLKPSDG